MAILSNVQLWNYLRKTNPNFRSHTAEGTKELFTDKGFEALKVEDIDAINEFFNLSMRVSFQKLTSAGAKNPLADIGLVEVYNTPNGGFIQRLSVSSIKPVTPAYKGLQDGDSVDPFIVRKPESNERFFQQNYDYQSFITIQDFQVKTIFISEFGMSDYIAGIMRGLQNGYTVQNYVNVLETLNAGLNSATYPLKDSQNLQISNWTATTTLADVTEEMLLSFVEQLQDIATQMETSASTKAFNAASFDTAYNNEDFVVLMRAGIKNRIKTRLRVGAYNPDDLAIPFGIKEVENFGGLIPKDEDDTTMQEAYDRFGAQVGFIGANVTPTGPAYKTSNGTYEVPTGQGAVAVSAEPDHYEDPNEDILAIVAQKGIVFESIQNPYEVRPIYNPRGLYENFWASSPNNTIAYDPLYAVIVIRKGQA